MRFNVVVCGGTFDHFHKGHRLFLEYAFGLGNKVIVGLTSDTYVRSWKIEAGNLNQIESFEKRKQAVLEFIKSEGVLGRVEIAEINDLFGPTLRKDLTIDTIIVSEDTKKGAEIVNQKRKELGLKELNLLIAPQVLAEDGKLISSQRIRKGEINKEGKLYVKREWFSEDLKLAEDLRGEFQKPFGELLKNGQDLSKNKNNLVITVGDVTAKIFNEKSLEQNISVIDFKVARKNKFSNISELGFTGEEKIFQADNPAGYITSDVFRTISKIFKSDLRGKIILRINGEEDLVVLPLVLCSSLNTTIYYGQPPQRLGFAGQAGIVRVVVSEESKNKAYNLVSRLKIV